MKSGKQTMTGNGACGVGAILARPDVIAAYPITPQTSVVETIAKLVDAGELDCEYIKVDSEHSGMAACVSAAQTGVRVFTATSSHGLALMHEMLIWAAGARVPIVMPNANRAMAMPWSVWADHLDSICQRDTGWMQVYAENNQEVLDTVLMAYKVAESVYLPCMINMDAFLLTHTVESVDVPSITDADEFLPPIDPLYELDTANPYFVGTIAPPDGPAGYYVEWRYKMHEAMEKAKARFVEVGKEFGDKFGRYYDSLLDLYRCDDADVVMVTVGTVASTTRIVVDAMRKEGKKVGMARIRVFRPFPVEEFRKLAENVKVFGVINRVYSVGVGGPFTMEVKNALYGMDVDVMSFITGVGGRDIIPEGNDVKMGIRQMYDILLDGKMTGEIWTDLKMGESMNQADCEKRIESERNESFFGNMADYEIGD